MAVEHEEFNALLQKYARVMAAAIRRVCRERHRALVPDIEQEVHTALWKRLQSGKEITHPTSYLYKVALTTALAAVRKHVPEMTLGESDDLAAPEPESVFGNLLPAERATLLGQILEKLPREEARAVRAHLAGFSHIEVASLYGWTGSVARHRIYRGIETLREKMKSEAANGQRKTRGS